MKNLIVILIILLSFNVQSQENLEIKTINWLTFEEAGKKFETFQKPILVYIYDNKCDSCKLMDKETFLNQEVVNYLNVLFYCIKLNVETSDSIKFFNGQTFGKNPDKKYNDIIYSLIGEEIQLPALLMFNKQAQGSLFTGFKDRDHLFPLLIYYNEGIYNTYEFPVFEKEYFKAYPIGLQQIITRLNINWKTFDEMLEEQKTEPRKILIDLYYNYSISATMMRTQTYNDPIIAKYLNEKYYSTTVEAQGNDSISLKGITYVNSGETHKYHQFAIAALEGKMIFPAFIILDEDYNLLDRIQAYLTPKEIEAILKYYGDDIYKSKTYTEFLSTFDSSFD